MQSAIADAGSVDASESVIIAFDRDRWTQVVIAMLCGSTLGALAFVALRSPSGTAERLGESGRESLFALSGVAVLVGAAVRSPASTPWRSVVRRRDAASVKQAHSVI